MGAGTVFWITGLSGAGKSTIGKILFDKLKKQNIAVVYLDGDTLREVFGGDLGYSIEDRMKSAQRNSKLCKLLSDQGINVVCTTISMFHETREWNRNYIKNYREIFIDVPMEIIKKRDSKQIYSKNTKNKLMGSDGCVVGVDLNVEFPVRPDVVINNDGSEHPEIIVSRLMNELKI